MLFYVLFCVDCVVLCTVCVSMCTVLLPPGVDPIAVKYIISYHRRITKYISKLEECGLSLIYEARRHQQAFPCNDILGHS